MIYILFYVVRMVDNVIIDSDNFGKSWLGKLYSNSNVPWRSNEGCYEEIGTINALSNFGL